MKCPNCGMEVEGDSPFCPHCGQNISVRSKRKLRFILMDVQDDRRFRHLASAAVITVVIVAVLAVLLALGTGGDGPDDDNVGPSDGAIIISDTDYIELGGCFKDGDMSASIDQNGYLIVRLSGNIADRYSSFNWVLRNEFLNEIQAVTNDTGTLTWQSPSIGQYTVTVTCIDPATGGSEVFTGTIEYCGNVHTQYTFVYDGVSYTVYVDVDHTEYLHYSSGDIAYLSDRTSNTASAGSNFITTEGAVAILADRLMTAYGNPDNTSGFADFVLCFVQSCFPSGSDSYIHSQPVYWAFPSETLYKGIGDSGDLAVLAASILRSCGYDAGIAVIHGEAFVAVSLQEYTDTGGADGLHLVRVSEGGTQYYLGQLTEGRTALGYIGSEYGYSNGRYTYYGQDVSGESGIAIP